MFILILLLLATPVMAEENYVVSGGDVYKIETVPVSVEKANLEAELVQASSQVQSYKDNISIQQDGLAKAEAWQKDVEDKLRTISDQSQMQ